jgi:dimethylargininase
LRIAVTREVSPALQHCELSYQQRAEINLQLARAQHRSYIRALEGAGCRVVELPMLPDLADSVFVEDTAVVLDEVAVITRPGAKSRRPETDAMQKVLAGYRELRSISAPGTLDGGDVLRIGRDLYVGQSARSNRAGIHALAQLLAPFGYRVHGVPLKDCLHLKTAVTLLAADTLLIDPRHVDKRAFPGMGFVEVDPAEPHGGNALLIGDTVVYPASCPRTQARIEASGYRVQSVDMSETEKAEGGVTCCSLVFEQAG